MPYPTLLAHLRCQEAAECELGDAATDTAIKAVHFDLAERYVAHGVKAKQKVAAL